MREDSDVNPASVEGQGYALLGDQPREPLSSYFAPASDLDAFFSSCYNFYRIGGLHWSLALSFVDLMSLLVGGTISVGLSWVDWFKLAGCKDEQSCMRSLNDYMISPTGIHIFLTCLYSLLFVTYTASRLKGMLKLIFHPTYGSFAMAKYFDALGVNRKKVSTARHSSPSSG